MKYMMLLPAVLMTSCGLLESARETVSDPVVADQLEKGVQQALSGELVGAGWTLAGVGSLILGNWIKGRMVNSKEGEIIGGKA